MRRTHQPRRWKLLDNDIAAVSQLQAALNLHPIIARLLVQRGISTPEAASRFLNPSLDDLHDPFLLPDAEVACERIKKALHEKQKILIHGDYDGDGVTSAALWTRCLRALGGDVDVFVPHRKRDGYDMRSAFIEQARHDSVQLIITTDCGIQRIDEVSLAREYGIDVIVTDHHTPNADGTLPGAIAVVNPHRRDSLYPFANLAGVGVAFRLCEALTIHLGHKVAAYRKGFLDLAAIGTITDVMPLVDENRVIVRHGLAALRETKKPGLRALLEVTNAADRPIDTRTVGFGIGPRLNSAGRIDETQLALDVLLTKDPDEAQSLARRLDELNAQRKDEQARVLEEAMAIVTQQNAADARCLVVSGTGWPSGIVGLVAGKICERFHRPSVVIAIAETGEGKGSARSIAAFNIYDAIHTCGDMLLEYGGHSYAAGIAIAGDRIAEFATKMNKIATAVLTDEDCVATLDAVMEADQAEFNLPLVRQIENLAPFGAGNPQPLFISRNVSIAAIANIGKKQEHLRFRLNTGGQGYGQVDALWFYHGELGDALRQCPALDFCYQPRINEYEGRQRVQFVIEDLNTAEW